MEFLWLKALFNIKVISVAVLFWRFVLYIMWVIKRIIHLSWSHTYTHIYMGHIYDLKSGRKLVSVFSHLALCSKRNDQCMFVSVCVCGYVYLLLFVHIRIPIHRPACCPPIWLCLTRDSLYSITHFIRVLLNQHKRLQTTLWELQLSLHAILTSCLDGCVLPGSLWSLLWWLLRKNWRMWCSFWQVINWWTIFL